MMRRFFAAWRFLTVFPAPAEGSSPEAVSALSRSLPYFPAVGLVLGAISWLAARILGTALPPLAVAAVMTALLAAYSCGLHLDGLADSADGLFGPHDRERALEIMRDSRIGAMGAATLILVLLVKFACLASAGDGIARAALLAPLGGRSAMLAAMTLLPYARSSGLGSVFAAGSKPAAAIAACLWLAVCCAAFLGVGGLAVLAVWAAATAAWVVFLKIRLDGATGDGYGAACEFGETAVLLAVAALSKPGF